MKRNVVRATRARVILLLACGVVPASAVPRIAQTVALIDGIEVRHGATRLRAIALGDDVVRVRVAFDGAWTENATWAVSPERRTERVRVRAVAAGDDASPMPGFRTTSLTVHVDPETLRLTVTDTQGRVVSDDAPQPLSVRGAGFELRKRLPAGEHYFGLGDKTGPLDRRGGAFVNWNTDVGRFGSATDPLYKSIPFFVATGGDGGSYGLFLDNTWRNWFDFGRRDPDVLTIGADGGAIDYYLIHGPSMREVVSRYADLTGHAPLAPLWSLGYQQSRYSYASSAEARGIAARLRAERIPTDVLWLDIGYQDRNRPFAPDPVAYGDLPKLAEDLRAAGIRLVAITDPHIARAPGEGYAPYDSGAAGDHFVRRADGSVYVGEVWPGASVFPDFTRAASRAWWGGLYAPLVDAGVSGFWNDMNEPALFGTPNKTMPADVRHRIDTPGFAARTATHAEIHNVYGMQNTRATYDGVRALRPDERAFVMTRASYAGGQRYAATWTGDNSSTWEHLKLAVAQSLNLGLSGFGYVATDVGGFTGGASPELMTRWFQLSAFMPLFRNHSAIDAPRAEPWVDGPVHTAIRRRFVETRYRLLPYLYALADENAHTGAPLMRPLAFDYPDAARLPCDQSMSFLLGAKLLIAASPTPESAQPYKICLPAGGWYDYWSGRALRASGDGAAARIETPVLERVPVFVRAGTILPQQPLVQSTAETPRGPLSLHVYPGPDCTGVLYADDGHSMEYASGGFLRQTVRCMQSDAGLTVEFDARVGSYRPWWTRLEVIVHGWRGGAHATLAGHALEVSVDDAAQTVRVSIDDQPDAARLWFSR
jgi:alpha-glucosidase